MILRARIFFAAVLLIVACSCQAQQDADRELEARRKLAAPNPLEPSDSPWIEELTYMEVRDRIASGTSVAIIPTGGIEENGPYLATGKHNVILRAVCPAIARELGNALCAPVVAFVPEGNFDPPTDRPFSGYMNIPSVCFARPGS